MMKLLRSPDRLSIITYCTPTDDGPKPITAALSVLQRQGIVSIASVIEYLRLIPQDAAGEHTFRITSCEIRPRNGTSGSGTTAAMLQAAKVAIALQASVLDAQLWLCWAVNYLAAARALGIISRRAGELIVALAAMSVDQRALLGHLSLPAVTRTTPSSGRCFVAPSPLSLPANLVCHWSAMTEPLIRGGWLQLVSAQGHDSVPPPSLPPITLLPASCCGAPDEASCNIAQYYLAVAIDTPDPVTERWQSNATRRYTLQASSKLRAAAREIAAMALGRPSLAIVASEARSMLLGLSRMTVSPLVASRDIPAAEPFVYFPSRVTWAQAVGAAAWTQCVSSACQEVIQHRSDPTVIKAQVARALHLPRVFRVSHRNELGAHDAGQRDGVSAGAGAPPHPTRSRIVADVADIGPSMAADWPYVNQHDGSPAAGVAYVWRRCMTEAVPASDASKKQLLPGPPQQTVVSTLEQDAHRVSSTLGTHIILNDASSCLRGAAVNSMLARNDNVRHRLRALGIVDVTRHESATDVTSAVVDLKTAWHTAAQGSDAIQRVWAPLIPAASASSVHHGEGPSASHHQQFRQSQQQPTHTNHALLALRTYDMPFGHVRVVPGVDRTSTQPRADEPLPPLTQMLCGALEPVCVPAPLYARFFVQRYTNPVVSYCDGLLHAAITLTRVAQRQLGLSSRASKDAHGFLEDPVIHAGPPITDLLRGSICAAPSPASPPSDGASRHVAGALMQSSDNDSSSGVSKASRPNEPSIFHQARRGEGALLEAARLAYFVVRLVTGDEQYPMTIAAAEARGLIVRPAELRTLMWTGDSAPRHSNTTEKLAPGRLVVAGTLGLSVAAADTNSAKGTAGFDTPPRNSASRGLFPSAPQFSAEMDTPVPGAAAGLDRSLLLFAYNALTNVLELGREYRACIQCCGEALRAQTTLTDSLIFSHPCAKLLLDRQARVLKRVRKAKASAAAAGAIVDENLHGDVLRAVGQSVDDDDHVVCGGGTSAERPTESTPMRSAVEKHVEVKTFTLISAVWPEAQVIEAAAAQRLRPLSSKAVRGVYKVSESEMQRIAYSRIGGHMEQSVLSVLNLPTMLSVMVNNDSAGGISPVDDEQALAALDAAFGDKGGDDGGSDNEMNSVGDVQRWTDNESVISVNGAIENDGSTLAGVAAGAGPPKDVLLPITAALPPRIVSSPIDVCTEMQTRIVAVNPRMYFVGLHGEPASVEMLVVQAVTLTVSPMHIMRQAAVETLLSTDGGYVSRVAATTTDASCAFPAVISGTREQARAWQASVQARAASGARVVGNPSLVKLVASLGTSHAWRAGTGIADAAISGSQLPDGGVASIDASHPNFKHMVFEQPVTHVVEPCRGFVTPALHATQLGGGAHCPAFSLDVRDTDLPLHPRGTGWRCIMSENMMWYTIFGIVMWPVIMATPASVIEASLDGVNLDTCQDGGNASRISIEQATAATALQMLPPLTRRRWLSSKNNTPPAARRPRDALHCAMDTSASDASMDVASAVYVPPSLLSRPRRALSLPLEAAVRVASNLRWVWKHPWQGGPADIDTTDFVPLRRPLYDGWLAALRDMNPCELAAHAASVYDDHWGSQTTFVRWHTYRRDDLCELLHAAGAAVVSLVAASLAEDRLAHDSGLPDIATWRPLPCPHCPFGVAGDGNGADSQPAASGNDVPNDDPLSLYRVAVDAKSHEVVIRQLVPLSPSGSTASDGDGDVVFRRGRWHFTQAAYRALTASAHARTHGRSADFLLMEVKSPNDSVRRHQLEWFTRLAPVAHVVVMMIRAKRDPSSGTSIQQRKRRRS